MATESPWLSPQPQENTEILPRGAASPWQAYPSEAPLSFLLHLLVDPVDGHFSKPWACCLPFQPHSHMVPALEDYAAM